MNRFFFAVISMGIASSPAQATCTKDHRTQLEQAGYSACAVADLCKDAPLYYRSPLELSESAANQLIEQLKPAGCGHLVILPLETKAESAKRGSQTQKFQLISTNCALGAEGYPCPKALSIKPTNSSAAVFKDYQICYRKELIQMAIQGAPTK